MAQEQQPGEPAALAGFWTELPPRTRQWFLDHAGIVIVPRTVTAELCRTSRQSLPQDAHGQYLLSTAEMTFIRSRVHSAYAAQGTTHLFDAAQPRNRREPGAQVGVAFQTESEQGN